VDLGALAQFKVDGKWHNDLMEQVEPPHDSPEPKAADKK